MMRSGFSVLVVLSFVFTSCSHDRSTSPVPDTGLNEIAYIDVSPEVAEIEIDNSGRLQAVAYDASDNPIDGVTFDWVSSDNSVATVDANGEVTVHGPGRAVITASCGSDTSRGAEVTPYRVVYKNSFETAEDTIGWHYPVGSPYLQVFWNDTPPGGNSKSLYVSGIEVFPTAYYDLEPVNRDRYVTLQVWGKTIAGKGSVYLRLKDQPSDSQMDHLDVLIDYPEWRLYKARTVLFCPAGEVLRIELWCGHFIYWWQILVDELEIREILSTDSEGKPREDI